MGTFKRHIAHLCVSGIFQNFDVDFWPLLKAEKVLPRSNFGGKKIFLQNFIFFHPFESINFQPAGFLAFKEKSGPLLQPHINHSPIVGKYSP